MAETYDIYHDESKGARGESYWHGFLFVPRSARCYLLDLLQEARRNVGFLAPLSYKDIRRTDRPSRSRAALAASWTSIAIASVQQQKFSRLATAICLGGRPPVYRQRLAQEVRCKLVVFKERDNHASMFSGLTGLECIETTFRMGLKGGLHYLFDEQHPVIVSDVFIDGDEHYISEFGRSFDSDRSRGWLSGELRSYVSFLPESRLIAQRSDHTKIESHQDTDDSQLLQLCDILLGGVRFHSSRPDSTNVKYQISYPCRELLGRERSNYARMKRSRFFKGFSLSEAWLEQDEWHFRSLRPAQDEASPTGEQLRLL